MRSSRGKVVRADYRVERGATAGAARGRQLLEGSPVRAGAARAPAEDVVLASRRGTRVTLTVLPARARHRAAGDVLLRRATRRRVDDALSALEETLK
jgi:hypothetical protein